VFTPQDKSRLLSQRGERRLVFSDNEKNVCNILAMFHLISIMLKNYGLFYNKHFGRQVQAIYLIDHRFEFH